MQGLVHSQVFKTKDYSQFILDSEYNREVNLNHVKKIKKSIQLFGDSGECFPIVVDEKGVIIDGQHRFTARKELGLTIYYIQSTELESKKLGGINDAVAKWKPEVYTKVSKDNKIIVYLKTRFMPYIPEKTRVLSSIFHVFTIRKDNILIDSPITDLKHKNIVEICPKLIDYLTIMEMNMLDFKQANITVKIIYGMAKKCAKYNVPYNEIIEGTYAEIMSDLYKRNLVK